MNSSIFRRNTRKSSCGCSRGGANSNANAKTLKNATNRLVMLERKSAPGMPERGIYRRKFNAQKKYVNSLKAAKANTGILSAITNKVQNAVQVVKNNVTRTENSITKANNTVQNSSAPQAVVAAEAAANTAVVAANVAVNKSRNLVALANRAQALANNIRKTVGGKRRKHHRTHRK